MSTGGGGGAGGGAPPIGESTRFQDGALQMLMPDGSWRPVRTGETQHASLVRNDYLSFSSAGIFGATIQGGGVLGASFTASSSPIVASPTRSFATATGYTGQMGGGSLAFTPARQSSGAGMGAGAGGTGM